MSSPYESIISGGHPTGGGPATAETNLLLGVPKKGRLAKLVLEMLNGAGLDHTRPPRLDVATCDKLPVTLVFLPAADIAKYVGEGNVDMGITGEDIIAETGQPVVTLMQLGLGKCELAVEAPVGRFKDPADIAGLRVVTSFPKLATEFFDQYDQEKGTKTQVSYVSGSVEVACSLGLADAVVDLVETGTTMRAAGLEKVGTVMETQTVLIANPRKHTRPMVQKLHKRFKGYVTAKKHSMMAFNILKADLPKAVAITPGANGPTVSDLNCSDGKEWSAVQVMVKTKEISDLMDQLEEAGATSIIVYDLKNCRV